MRRDDHCQRGKDRGQVDQIQVARGHGLNSAKALRQRPRCNAPESGSYSLPGRRNPYFRPAASASMTHRASLDSFPSIPKASGISPKSSQSSDAALPENCLDRTISLRANAFHAIRRGESPGRKVRKPAKSSSPVPQAAPSPLAAWDGGNETLPASGFG